MTNLKTNIIGLSRDQIKSILVDANLIKLNENFRDGKKKGKSRPGRVKKAGAADPFKFDPIPPGSMFKDFASISAVTAASEGLAELLQEELSVQQKFRICLLYTSPSPRDRG